MLADGECITDHAVASAKLALEMAGVSGQDVDMVLLATSSPDDVFGSATQVRTQLCLAQQCLLRLRSSYDSCCTDRRISALLQLLNVEGR